MQTVGSCYNNSIFSQFLVSLVNPQPFVLSEKNDACQFTQAAFMMASGYGDHYPDLPGELVQRRQKMYSDRKVRIWCLTPPISCTNTFPPNRQVLETLEFLSRLRSQHWNASFMCEAVRSSFMNVLAFISRRAFRPVMNSRWAVEFVNFTIVSRNLLTVFAAVSCPSVISSSLLSVLFESSFRPTRWALSISCHVTFECISSPTFMRRSLTFSSCISGTLDILIHILRPYCSRSSTFPFKSRT